MFTYWSCTMKSNIISDSENYKKQSFEAEIDCPVCAKEVENILKQNENIKECSFDFLNGKLIIDSNLDKKELINLIHKSSDEVKIKDDFKKLTIKASIDCQDCADKITTELLKHPEIKDCSFDILRKKLIVSTSLAENEIKTLSKEVDGDIEFFEEEKAFEKNENTVRWIRIGISLAIVVISKLFSLDYLSIIAYLIAGYDVLFKAVKNILKGKAFDENFLMTVATIGALFLKSFEEAAAVMLLYQIGETLQSQSIRKSRKSIEELMDIDTQMSNLKLGDEIKRVPTSSVEKGSTLIIKPGEKIPLDGYITKGNSLIDYKALTGEAVPVFVKENDHLSSGGINTSNLIEIVTDTTYENSTVKRILDLMEKAKEKKTESENFITSFSKYYTPIVCLIALAIIIIPPLMGIGSFSTWLYRGLMLLVISCPCALVISVPLSYFSATGAFAKRGILIKNSAVIQNLATLDTICFDKTGTLTKGEFKVNKIETDMDKERILQIAKSLEYYSTHPIAKAVVKESSAPLLDIKNLTQINGKGIEGFIDNDKYLIGDDGNSTGDNDNGETVCHLYKNGDIIATLYLQDEVKAEAKEVISELKKFRIKSIMLTGDKENVAKSVSQSLYINEYKARLMPEDKLIEIEKLIEKGNFTAFVGDGINDSPTLTRADIGISMGQIGSDAAIEASDMVIMKDDLSKLITAIKLSKITRNVVYQNIYFSIGIKVAIMVMAILGIANMWLAIFADVGVSILATLNAMRTLFIKKE